MRRLRTNICNTFDGQGLPTFLLLILQPLDEGVCDGRFRIHLQRRVQQREIFLGGVPEFAFSHPEGVGAGRFAAGFQLGQSFISF